MEALTDQLLHRELLLHMLKEKTDRSDIVWSHGMDVSISLGTTATRISRQIPARHTGQFSRGVRPQDWAFPCTQCDIRHERLALERA